MIPDSVCRVAFDRVATEVSEFSPAGKESRGCGDDIGNGGPALRFRQGKRCFEPSGIVGFRGRNHRGRNTAGELNRLVAHALDRTGLTSPMTRIGCRGLRRGGPYDGQVLALDLDAAKNIAIALAAVFAIGSVVSAWIMKTIIQKVATALVLAVLAFAVWSQRTSLQDCADKVKDAYERNGTSVSFIDTDCSFFGATITISDPRNGDQPADGTG